MKREYIIATIVILFLIVVGLCFKFKEYFTMDDKYEIVICSLDPLPCSGDLQDRHACVIKYRSLLLAFQNV